MNFYKNQFWYYKSALDVKTCDKIIKAGKSILKQKAKVLNDKEKKKIRNSYVTWLNDQWIYDLICPFIYGANKSAGWNVDIDWFEDIQFTEYNKKQHYDWHQDSVSYNEGHYKNKIRKLSCVVSLTDPKKYKGGDFYFAFDETDGIKRKEDKVNEMKERGTVLVFPSYLYHKVASVTQGTRHSLVIWALGGHYK